MQCCVVNWKLTYGFIKQPELCKEINLLVIMSQTVSGLGKKKSQGAISEPKESLLLMSQMMWLVENDGSHIIMTLTSSEQERVTQSGFKQNLLWYNYSEKAVRSETNPTAGSEPNMMYYFGLFFCELFNWLKRWKLQEKKWKWLRNTIQDTWTNEENSNKCWIWSTKYDVQDFCSSCFTFSSLLISVQ